MSSEDVLSSAESYEHTVNTVLSQLTRKQAAALFVGISDLLNTARMQVQAADNIEDDPFVLGYEASKYLAQIREACGDRADELFNALSEQSYLSIRGDTVFAVRSVSVRYTQKMSLFRAILMEYLRFTKDASPDTVVSLATADASLEESSSSTFYGWLASCARHACSSVFAFTGIPGRRQARAQRVHEAETDHEIEEGHLVLREALRDLHCVSGHGVGTGTFRSILEDGELRHGLGFEHYGDLGSIGKPESSGFHVRDYGHGVFVPDPLMEHAIPLRNSETEHLVVPLENIRWIIFPSEAVQQLRAEAERDPHGDLARNIDKVVTYVECAHKITQMRSELESIE